MHTETIAYSLYHHTHTLGCCSCWRQQVDMVCVWRGSQLEASCGFRTFYERTGNHVNAVIQYPNIYHPNVIIKVNTPGMHLPVVYDRQFYCDIFKQYAAMLSKSKTITTEPVLVPHPANQDPRRQRQQFEKFCETELGFRVQDISNFAVHFGWEGAWVGPLHVVGTSTKNTYTQWLQIFHALGYINSHI